MTKEQRPLNEIVEKLEAAWNNSDSVAWTALFADDSDFIHVLGGHFHGRTEIECGHRTIFDTIYKGSLNGFKVEGVRFVRPDVAIVFIFATSYSGGGEEPGRRVENRDVSKHTGDHRRGADIVGHVSPGAPHQGQSADREIARH